MQKAMISAGGSSIGQDAMMIYPATELETHPVVSPVSLQLGIVPGGDRQRWGGCGASMMAGVVTLVADGSALTPRNIKNRLASDHSDRATGPVRSMYDHVN